MDQKGQYLAHNDQKYIGPNLDFFLLKFLVFWRGSKSFSTNISENQLGTFFQLFFLVVHSTTMDQKGKYLAQKDQKNNFWSKGPVPFTQLVKVRRGKLVLALPSIRFS